MPLVVRHSRQPAGMPVVGDFNVTDEVQPLTPEGSALVATGYFSLDPGLRSKIRDLSDSELVGKTVEASALGRIVDGNDSGLQTGQLVRGRWGWREYASVRSDELEIVDEQPDVALADELGVLGMPGMVAYVGLLDIGSPKPGEVVYVSAAAGAVGSMVGQIAKILGCETIGSAGSDEKVRLLTDLGFDHAFNYHDEPINERLRECAPNGIDVYFDNVGGDQLQAGLDNMARHGRIVCCGSVSAYNDDPRGPALHGLRQMVTSRLRMQGFVIWDHADRADAHRQDTLDWIRSGKLRPLRTVTTGIENTPEAFIALLSGRNIGKASVRV